MAQVTFDIVRGIVDREGIDNLTAWEPGKKSGKLYEVLADGPGVLAALDLLKSNVSGAVLVEAWNSGQKKAEGYTWNVGNVSPMNVGALGAGVGGPSWVEYMGKSIELETLKLRHEFEGKADPMAGLAKTLELYAPIIAKSIGVKLPTAPIAGHDDDDDDDDEVPPGGIGPEELEAMLTKAAEFARANPDKARLMFQHLSDA